MDGARVYWASTSLVVLTSTSTILQFLNSLVCPETSFNIIFPPSAFAWTTSFQTSFPFSITLNSHIIFAFTYWRLCFAIFFAVWLAIFDMDFGFIALIMAVMQRLKGGVKFDPLA